MKRYWRILAAASCTLLVGSVVASRAGAAEARPIRLIVGSDSAFARDTANRLKILLDQAQPGIVMEEEAATAVTEATTRLTVTVGEQAWKAAASLQGNGPILAVAPNRSVFAGEEKRLVRNSSALFIEQPIERVLNLASLLKPQGARVGALLGPTGRNLIPQLQAAASERKLYLHLETANEEAIVGRVLAGVIRDTNVLLAIPDPVVQTPNTVQPFLLMSYRAGIPVIGYSAAYQRAGAMVSLYTTPEQIARQATEAIVAWRQGKGLPAPREPKYFTVGINTAVARSLGIALPDADALEQKLRAMKE